MILSFQATPNPLAVGVDKLLNAATQGNLQQVKFLIENEGIYVDSKHSLVMNESLYFIVSYF